MKQTDERAFEAYVEATLFERRRWERAPRDEWVTERALFPTRVYAFLQRTRPKLWEEMRALYGAGLEALLTDALAKELGLKGTLHILRHGFKFYGKTFRLAYCNPAHGLNEEVLALYEKNELTVTRQVPCHPGKGDSADFVFALNGLLVATCELKNPGSG